MKYTFNLPYTGNISLEGSEEDLNSFLSLVRIALFDATFYCRYYAKYPNWAKQFEGAHDCLNNLTPYADPTLDLPF